MPKPIHRINIFSTIAFILAILILSSLLLFYYFIKHPLVLTGLVISLLVFILAMILFIEQYWLYWKKHSYFKIHTDIIESEYLGDFISHFDDLWIHLNISHKLSAKFGQSPSHSQVFKHQKYFLKLSKQINLDLDRGKIIYLIKNHKQALNDFKSTVYRHREIYDNISHIILNFNKLIKILSKNSKHHEKHINNQTIKLLESLLYLSNNYKYFKK